MVFKLRMSANHISENDHLLEEYKRIGFRFIATDDTFWAKLDLKLYVDEEVSPSIKIETIEELSRFINTFEAVVISKNEIEIYNDYRE